VALEASAWWRAQLGLLCCTMQNFAALVPLALLLGEVTEDLALRFGDTIGGLLNATFGNVVELILSLAALRAGLFDVVAFSLIGSVLSNLLLVLGARAVCLSVCVFGGVPRCAPRFVRVVLCWRWLAPAGCIMKLDRAEWAWLHGIGCITLDTHPPGGSACLCAEASPIGSHPSGVAHLHAGCCFLVGGFRHKEQKFNPFINKALSSLLLLACIGIAIPSAAKYAYGPDEMTKGVLERVSRGIACMLIFVCDAPSPLLEP
jgi:Ca2+/H+ antiporter